MFDLHKSRNTFVTYNIIIAYITMEKEVAYELRWKTNGFAHSRQYDSERIALICFDECKSIKANTDVILTKITFERISTTKKEPKRLRNFVIIHFTKESGLGTAYYEIRKPDDLKLFIPSLSDRDVFNVNIYVSETVPPFIKRAGFQVVGESDSIRVEDVTKAIRLQKVLDKTQSSLEKLLK